MPTRRTGQRLFVMLTPLTLGGVIPLSQPYNMFPWNYNGTESTAVVPANVVDWVLVELRDATSAANATSAMRIARQAGFLLGDGSIVSTDGNSPLFFSVSVLNNLYTVVHHRNHLGILSANALTPLGGNYSYDFTTGFDKTYGETFGCKELAPGIWGMIGGDANCDGEVSEPDISVTCIRWQEQKGIIWVT